MIGKRQLKKIRDGVSPTDDFASKLGVTLNILLELTRIKTLPQEQTSRIFANVVCELEKSKKTQWETTLLGYFLHCYTRPQLRRLRNNAAVLSSYYVTASDLPDPTSDYLPDLNSGSSSSESGLSMPYS